VILFPLNRYPDALIVPLALSSAVSGVCLARSFFFSYRHKELPYRGFRELSKKKERGTDRDIPPMRLCNEIVAL
jgi:hypothetical protein